MARAAAHVDHPARRGRGCLRKATQHALGHHIGGIREAIQEVGAFDVGAQHRDELAIGGRVPTRQQRAEGGAALTVEAQQHIARVVGAARFERHDGRARSVVGDEHRNAVHHRKRAALAAEHAGVDAPMGPHQREVLDWLKASTAERAAKQGEERLVHGFTLQTTRARRTRPIRAGRGTSRRPGPPQPAGNARCPGAGRRRRRRSAQSGWCRTDCGGT